MDRWISWAYGSRVVPPVHPDARLGDRGRCNVCMAIMARPSIVVGPAFNILGALRRREAETSFFTQIRGTGRALFPISRRNISSLEAGKFVAFCDSPRSFLPLQSRLNVRPARETQNKLCDVKIPNICKPSAKGPFVLLLFCTPFWPQLERHAPRRIRLLGGASSPRGKNNGNKNGVHSQRWRRDGSNGDNVVSIAAVPLTASHSTRQKGIRLIERTRRVT